MKKLIIAYLFTITNVFAAPPTYFNGELQTNTYIQNIKAPNYQTTPLGGIDRRLETGNLNELQNPNFEHTTVSTGWTVSNATVSGNTANPLEGKKSISLALTGALSLSQSSTINAAQKSGVQMVASIWVNSTDVSDLQLCSLKNGSEDKCTVTGGYVQGSGWRQLTISFIGNATSNGLKLKSTDTTGTVLVDSAFVGVGSPIVDFGGGEYVGRIRYQSVSNCAWTTTSTSWANFSADTDCQTPTIDGAVSAPTTKIPAIVIPDYREGKYLIQVTAYGSVASVTSSATGGLRISDGTNMGSEMFSSISFVGGVNNAAHSTTYTSTIINTTSSTNATLQMQGYTNNASNSMGIYANSSNQFEIVVYYFPNKTSKAYVASGSVALNTTVYSAQVSNTGVVSNENIDFINGNCSVSTATYTCNYISTLGLTVPMTCVATSGEVWNVAFGGTNTTSAFSFDTAGPSGAAAASNFRVMCQKQGADYTAAFNPVIVGSFQGYNETPGVSAPKLFSFRVTTTSGAVANNRGGYVTSCTAANPTVCTLTGLSSAPTCSTTITGASSGGNNAVQNALATSTSLNIYTYTTSTGSASASQPVEVVCHGN